MTESPVTLITGGSSGIGAATARRLLNLGHRVTITGRDQDRLDRFAKELGEPAGLLAIAGDAADHVAVRSAVEATMAKFDRLDNAIANAGFAVFDTITDADPAAWRDMVLTNVLGPVLLIQTVLPELRRTRGRIVLIGSVAGFVNSPGNVYGATKWAVTGLAENIRRQVTGDGVGVTLIAPGAVRTNFFDKDPNIAQRRDFLPVDQLADTIEWVIGQPRGVDVNTVVVRPTGQPV